jgi:feruloyl esterase
MRALTLAVSALLLGMLIWSCGESDSDASPTPTATPSATATPVNPQAACDALDGRTLAGADLTARLVAAAAAYPEHCKVLGTIPPRLKLEVRLPSDWNRRALFIGGGGLNGIIPSPEALLFNPSIAADGYATIATDSGHQGSPLDGSWALNDPHAVEDFADGATPKVLDAARAVIAQRYGRDAEQTYFIGTSTGGREGLIAAQRFPEAFDGIVALEPVYDMMALVLAGNRVAQQVFATPGGRLSPAHLQTLGAAVLAACDGLDGIDDGIISHVAACRFDPAVLRCDGPEGDHCLTDAQIATVNLVHAKMPLGVTIANGVDSYPGWPIGHEDNAGGWKTWIACARADPSTTQGSVLSGHVMRFIISRDPALDPLHFSPN